MSLSNQINFGLLILTIVSCGISLRSCSQANSAIEIAKESNIIAINGNALAQNANQLALKSNEISDQLLSIQVTANKITQEAISKENVEKVFETLYSQDRFKKIIQDIKGNHNAKIANINDLGSFVDIFEGIGGQYCSGIATSEQIKTFLGKTLNPLCYNKQAISLYGGKKNGVAMLCKRFFPESDFASLAKNEEGCILKNN